jgi:hypothetical protein
MASFENVQIIMAQIQLTLYLSFANLSFYLSLSNFSLSLDLFSNLLSAPDLVQVRFSKAPEKYIVFAFSRRFRGLTAFLREKLILFCR